MRNAGMIPPQPHEKENPFVTAGEAIAQTLYRDAGAWARHFSCVRLSLALVLVLGGAITTMTAQHISTVFRVGVFVWLTGIVAFTYFTSLVIRMQNRQRQIRAESLCVQASYKSRSLWTDIPFWLVLGFSLGAMVSLFVY
jgi:hypothetical protein